MEKTEILKVRNGKTQNKKTEEFADETESLYAVLKKWFDKYAK